ncbi:MAG: AAA family ATPase [Flavobacteriaceae bacterium]|nr:AAA family ATPase [Flavobacteriaceae bacterium]
MNIPQKTLDDLELQKVLLEIEKFAKTERVKRVIQRTKPIENYNQLMFRLKATDEFLSALQGANRFPFGDYSDIRDELEKLEIENYRLSASSFLSIRSQMLQILELIRFLNKFESYYPVFHRYIQKIDYKPEILSNIERVFDKHGEIKDNASPTLKNIRKNLKEKSQQLSETFSNTMRANREYLDDIGESVIDGKRVLAVAAMHRRKVAGRLLGNSKSGSISYIEPESVLRIQREFDELIEEEKREIDKILLELTDLMRDFQFELISYQNFLFQLDLISSQAQYAYELNAILPKINEEKHIHLIDAYHPILLLKHKKEQKKIIPQTLGLDSNNRILVISGPNAGGKSITLKTIGLLQLMLQSGILIPVHENSEMSIFSSIFTDIGDNQSIENQLSTYSYRLKQMQYFLKKSDENTLLLIDEFGTGSDPELGGALAEVFLEEFYEMEAFGVFTTHYTNIKILVEDLESAQNASMLFDEKTLEPMYLLETGQAGSSFTFEVAQKNHIPFRLINRAKKKIERNKVRLDKTILKLQQEKFDVQKTKNQLQELKNKSEEKQDQLEQTQDKIQSKLVDFQRLYESEQKYVQMGKKIDEMADEYMRKKSRKKLISDFLKMIEMQNASKTKQHFTEKRKERLVLKKLQVDLDKNADKIEEAKEKLVEKEKEITKNKIASLKIGDRVRIKGSVSSGTVEKVENQTITINYGKFRTKISIFDVEKI